MASRSEWDHTPPTRGLRLIIAYKLVKAPLMVALAIWLTFWPMNAYDLGTWLAEELSAGGAIWARAGDWLAAHLSEHLVRSGAALAWLDAIVTGLEAVLLLLRKPWAEWMVTAGLALLLPLEIISLRRKPSIAKVGVLLINAAIVAYLARRRLRAAQIHRHRDVEGISAR